MDVNALRSKVSRLEQELEVARDELQQATDPEAVSAELKRTRAYAFDAASEGAVEKCSESIRNLGFCVIDNVIPQEEVAAIRDEAIAARSKVDRNVEAVKDLHSETGLEGAALLEEANARGVELRPVRRVGHPPKIPCEIIWMPSYARYLAHPVVTAVARRVLDDHMRIAQLHIRVLEDRPSRGEPIQSGSETFHLRKWHTDWPHDLSAYGRSDPSLNVGCIRQPFPDVTMCLVMIWNLTDVDETSAGTWVVPGSHRDKRNPRGPNDGVIVSAPIPGDMQIEASAGSVYIQDSRCWHAAAVHNNSGRQRVVVVNRWCPWWVSVDDFAPGVNYNVNQVCRPLSHSEYLDLPADLQPLLRHVCPDEHDTLQQSVLARSQAAGDRDDYGYRQVEEDADSVAKANAHIRVPMDQPSD